MNTPLNRKEVYQKRLKKCTELMKEEGLNVLLLAKPANMFYLTGDGRLCAYAMITEQGQVALGVPKTDVEDVKSLAVYDHLIGFEDEIQMIHSIAHFFEQFGIKEGVMGLEYTYLTQSMMGMFTHPHAKPEEVKVKDCTAILSALRMVKELEEIELIQKAAKVAVSGMQAAVSAVRPGCTENEIAAHAEYAMRCAGAEGFWRTYISSGPRTNIAHGLPTLRKVEPGDLVMIDLHPIVNGYSADICRTISVGKASEEQQGAYKAYLNAQQTTIAQVKSRVNIKELEEFFHKLLREAGHSSHIFGPPIHGVGIEFEEAPLPPGHAFFHGEKEPPPLPENVIIAVGNCGLYLGPWGVRVEDTILIEREKAVILTSYPWELEAK